MKEIGQSAASPIAQCRSSHADYGSHRPTPQTHTTAPPPPSHTPHCKCSMEGRATHSQVGRVIVNITALTTTTIAAAVATTTIIIRMMMMKMLTRR